MIKRMHEFSSLYIFYKHHYFINNIFIDLYKVHIFTLSLKCLKFEIHYANNFVLHNLQFF